MVAVWLTAAELPEAPDVGVVRPWWFLLIGLILLGAAVIYFVDRWRKRPPVERLSTGDQLSQFRLLYEQGQLSREEYDRIKATLMPRLRQEINVPARPGEKPPAPPAPQGPPLDETGKAGLPLESPAPEGPPPAAPPESGS